MNNFIKYSYHVYSVNAFSLINAPTQPLLNNHQKNNMVIKFLQNPVAIICIEVIFCVFFLREISKFIFL